MKELHVSVYGRPVAQPRPRLGRRGAYTPDNGIKAWKEGIIYAAKVSLLQQHKGTRFTGPIQLTLIFSMPRPKSHFDSKGQIKAKYLNTYPAKKPDLDNLAKAVMDALTNAKIWSDDNAVVVLDCRKLYSSCTKTAGVDIVVSDL